MTNDHGEDALDALEDILEAERAALLHGNLEGMRRLVDKKESLVEQFAISETTDPQRLQNISHKILRNQDLLNEALNGINSVADRLTALRRVRQSLDTYDADGKKRSVQMNRVTRVEKRA